MARITTDQFLGALLGSRAPVRDEEPLESPSIAGPAPAPSALPAPAPVEDAAAVDLPPGPTPPPQSARAPSRQELLLSALQRPTREEGVKAALFDGLFGGTRYQDDLKARRNQFDQALIGAQAADAGAAERAGEAEAGRAMQREQMELTRRAQNLADQRAEDQRELQRQLLEQRLGAQKELQGVKDAAALERAKLGPHHKGAGGPAAPKTPEEIEAENERIAAFLTQQVNVAPEVAKAFVRGDQAALAGVPKETLDRLWANATNFKSLSRDKQMTSVNARLTNEGNVPDSVTAGVEKQKLNPKERLKLRQEVSDVGSDINDARQAWKSMSDSAKKVFAQYAGAGGDLAQTIKSARLSPEDQRYAGQLQSLANVLIKARSGSAVTGSEWNRVAQEIGWPTGDWSFFNSTAGIDGFLNKSSRAWTRRVNNIKSEYGDIWGSDG